MLRRALIRLWGRDVMLYTGGVSFFALLAFFPALSIIISLYGVMVKPDAAAAQMAALSLILPPEAQMLFQEQIDRLVHAPAKAVSAQSFFALVIGLYAAHRGIKALLAGLSFIHEDERPIGFVGFNLLALVVGVGAFALLAALSVVFVAMRLASAWLHLAAPHQSLFRNEWLWAGTGLTLGLTLLYRYAIAREAIGWRASFGAGVTAAALSLGASALSAVYVSKIAHLGAMYGSVGAVVVLLIWVSWNVNAVFYGGALASEIEEALGITRRPSARRRAQPHL